MCMLCDTSGSRGLSNQLPSQLEHFIEKTHLNICKVFSGPQPCQLSQCVCLIVAKLPSFSFFFSMLSHGMFRELPDKAFYIGPTRQNIRSSSSHRRTLNLYWDMGRLHSHPQSAWRKIKHSVCYLIGHKVQCLPYKWKALPSSFNMPSLCYFIICDIYFSLALLI